MTCKHNIPAQSLEGARSVSAQGCCPPDNTTPPDDEIVNPGEEINPGGDIPSDESPPIPQPNPQPDPVIRRIRQRVVSRPIAQRFPTPANRWRWRASTSSGTTPGTAGSQIAGGTITPGPIQGTIEER